MRARYYDPTIGSFVTEDPAFDGVNWYSYCGGNPVKYADCTGFSIYFENYYGKNIFDLNNSDDKLNESRKGVQGIMNALNELTDFHLVYNNGIIEVNYILKNPEEIKHPFGNMLIAALDSAEYDVKIYDKSIEESRGSAYFPDSKRIVIDPYEDRNKDIFVIKNNKLCSYDENLNPYPIVIAHELIHAQRDLYGIFDYSESMELNPYSNNEVLREEIQTVGLGKWYQNVVSNEHMVNGKLVIIENDMRNELSSKDKKIYPRGKY